MRVCSLKLSKAFSSYSQHDKKYERAKEDSLADVARISEFALTGLHDFKTVLFANGLKVFHALEFLDERHALSLANRLYAMSHELCLLRITRNRRAQEDQAREKR